MAEDRWSDPLVFGPVYGPDDEDGSQDDGSDGPDVDEPFDLAEAISSLDGLFDAYCAAAVEASNVFQRAAESMTGLTRAFHAPGCGPAAEVALRANCIDWDELVPSTLVPPGQVYVSKEPSMEELERKFNLDLITRACDPPRLDLAATMPITGPKFTLITGVC